MADCTELKAELAAIDAKIAAILANVPDNGFDWTVGHVRIDTKSRGALLKDLREHRDALWKTIQHRCPAEEVECVVTGVDEFGDEYLVD